MPGILNPFRFGTPTLSADAGTVSSGTGAVGTTVSVTGLTFQPRVLIFCWSQTAAVNTNNTGTIHRGVGFAMSPTDRRAVNAFSQHNVNPNNEANFYRDDCCVLLGGLGAVTAGRLDLQSMNADGFTLVVDEAFGAAHQLSWIALGGTKLTNATTFQFQEAASTGSQAITGIGFAPDALLFIGNGGGTTTPPAGLDHSIQSFGFATASASAVMAGAGKDAAAPGVQRNYIKTGECIALWDTAVTAIDYRASLTSLDADGFTLNTIERASSRWIFGLALKGPSVYIGNFVASTTLNDTQALTGFGFVPKAVLGMATRNAESTADTPVTGLRSWSIGGFTTAAAGSRWGHNGKAADAVSASSCSKGMRNDTWIYTGTGRVDVASIDADGFTTAIDAADTAMFIPFIAFG